MWKLRCYKSCRTSPTTQAACVQLCQLGIFQLQSFNIKNKFLTSVTEKSRNGSGFKEAWSAQWYDQEPDLSHLFSSAFYGANFTLKPASIMVARWLSITARAWWFFIHIQQESFCPNIPGKILRLTLIGIT